MQKPQKPRANKDDTSWQNVADWYDDLLESGGDSYQAKVILPNLLRLADIKKGDRVLDVACGQGFFSRAFAQAGAEVTGTDLSADLIALAKKHSPSIRYEVAASDKMDMLSSGSFDKAVIVLAIQNIKPVQETLKEVSRLFKKDGTLFIVLNHPIFRIPKNSSWGIDPQTGKQYRRIEAYMSESEVKIDMHPGKKDAPKTTSFHRPLQWYMKAFQKAGFGLIRLEEWISHKESQKGPHKAEEDRMRKEIPLFMCVELRKI